jgi:hypothetical protein
MPQRIDVGPDTLHGWHPPVFGDVVVRPHVLGTGPSFVLRVEPGPDQCGCRTLAAATQLATAFARQAGVDVWLEDAAGALSLAARFRASARRPRSAASPGGIGERATAAAR